jgi:hypothetical protein
MSPRRQQSERRRVPYCDDEVIIPFKFYDLSRIGQLDPLDSGGHVMAVATGEHPAPERRPYEPLTAWVTLAHLGLVEEDNPLFKAELTREQQLEAARAVLTEPQLMLVESIAVPKRYRSLLVGELEEMIRTAPDYTDRMWAGCWLTLVGWTESPECSFRDQSETPSRMMGELEEAIVEAYAASIGVTSRDDAVGWRRVDESYEANLIGHRLTLCETHYDLNGPPPYECMAQTLPLGSGWKQVIRVVPEKAR